MKKVGFDVNNEEHVDRFKQFFVNNCWGSKGCPFELEYPWLNIPDMIKDKLVSKMLGVSKFD